MFSRTLAMCASVLCGSTIAAAQPPGADPPAAIEVVPFLQDVTLLESWSFFEPPNDAVDASYRLLSNRATLGVRVRSSRLDVHGAFQYAQVFGLPRRATGPGPLGPGPLYYEAAGTRAAYQLYFKALSVRLKDILPGLSVQAGRMGFRSGVESPSASEAIAAIKADRLDGRLIGEVEWSTFERAFDGVRVDVDRPRWHTMVAALWPTQGVFEESANPTIDKIRLGTASLTLKSADARELQFSVNHYRDTRDITARPDNTLFEATNADISVATAGVSHVGLYLAGSGRVDTVVWFAGQVGDWYGVDHRAWSLMTEGGYQWPSEWRPWLRAGLQYASGDDDPTDARHGTFFPMLPSTRPDLLAGTFAQMNLRDLFGEIRLEPHPRVTLRADVHRLSLADARDRWYSGTGATARRGPYFGYRSRRSSGETGVGTLVQFSAEGALSKRWKLKASVGSVNGGGVIRGLFASHRLTVVSVQSVVGF